MGIQGFFNQIKNIYNIKSNEIINSSKIKSYDYVFFDFQSLIYNQLNLYSEINYLIYLLNDLFNRINVSKKEKDIVKIKNIFYKSDDTDTDDFKIMKYIIKKFDSVCRPLGFWIDEKNNINYFYNDKGGQKKIATLFKNEDNQISFYYKQLEILLSYIGNINNNLEDAIVDSTVNHVLDMIKYFMDINLTKYEDKDRYKNLAIKIKEINSSDDKGIFAYFDGIPSMAKISEQLQRRITGQIESLIKTNIKNRIFNNQPNILDTLIKPEMIKIGNNTQIVNKIYKNICENNIKCNEITEIGEAEHQIMEYLTKNKDKLQNKNILIISPDADLILLGLIQQSLNNLKIDIFKEEIINENHYEFTFGYKINPDKINSPYKINNYYTDLTKLKGNMDLNNNQILDICFIFLILGDDFIPTIPTFSAKSIPNIIICYKEILKINNNFKIVNNIENKCIFNHHNFIRFLQKLQKQEEKNYKETSKNYNMHPRALDSIDEKTEKFKDFFKLEENYEKYYYYINALNDSIYFINSNPVPVPISLKGSISYIDLKNKINNKDFSIKKYYEGCNFIFDLYFNNKIKNYQWYYDFDMSPMMYHILENFKSDKNIKEKFIIEKPKSDDYMNIESYKQYGDANKEEILKNIITELKPKQTVLRADVPEFVPSFAPSSVTPTQKSPMENYMIGVGVTDDGFKIGFHPETMHLYNFVSNEYDEDLIYILETKKIQNINTNMYYDMYRMDNNDNNDRNYVEADKNMTEFNANLEGGLEEDSEENFEEEYAQHKGGALEDDLVQYITYENIPKLYDCTNKKYFNKCLKYSIKLLPIDVYLKPKGSIGTSHARSLSGTKITIEYPTCPPKQNGGNIFYEKYLKYKNKYLNLKKLL